MNPIPPSETGGQVPGDRGTPGPAAPSSERPTDLDVELFVQLFDVAPTILTVTDRDLRVLAVNQTWSDATGVSKDEAVGAYIPDWYPTVDHAHWETLRQVMATGRPVHDDEVTARHPRDPSDTRTWRFSGYPLRDAAGTTVAVGLAAVDVTEERRAQAQRDLAWRRLWLLSEASGLLGASLDLDATLREMVTLIVPEVADVCVLLLGDGPCPSGVEPDPFVLRCAVWARSADLPRPPDPDRFQPGSEIDVAGTAVTRVFATHQPLLLDLDEPPGDAGPLRAAGLARQVGLRFAILVPLLNGTDCLGCVGFGLTADRRYDEQDLRAVTELGGRIAAAIANARAYEAQRAAALTLQRALLPHDIPALPELDLAWRYHPGTGGTEVGGDWLDVIPLPAGRVALVIGDVMGHGLLAAAAMGQLRTATRTLALLDLPPAEVLSKLDTLIRGIDTLATMIYAVFDPGAHTLTMANGGHLPPALRRPDGAVELLETTDGIMLGVADAAFTETQCPFPPGSTLALYTDGVVESPTVHVGEGTEHLLRVLAETTDLSTAADQLLALLDPADASDDATVLLARASGPRDGHPTVINQHYRFSVGR
ncbi:SpoIIE family protein phosphatase [Frankia sp. CNm7]|uniref:protein-serine/threonine phosphatase n=1 Tax=Frankia nepalensis TaxID=1836974 RepID=A0A937RJZ7_9ACTN|nr:SpoIIE family protein phosphatase [Frankia nepalensis]MBL7499554.1 SpoIIE family protein phosphatase [Frankia nepalensis]MBL7513182.1 SpoIIE family protein phosphatase [Frankia nepalensis]MBL7517591.1 SpoIIE family protein phosphatase [Frankia nepalensis]MBL7633678.1 SpoIIE family protein phosphatase [Frankia nepalensis]